MVYRLLGCPGARRRAAVKGGAAVP